jgi:soluble lytic murein transglycosylase
MEQNAAPSKSGAPRWGQGLSLLLLLFLLLFPAQMYWRFTRPFLHKDIIDRYASPLDVDPLFVLAVVHVESGFIAAARSHRGALGLMQLMPDTAREMAQRAGIDERDLDFTEPEINIQLGVTYLSLLQKEFPGDPLAVLAAYNAGPTNARAWKRDGLLTVDRLPFPETRAFAQRVLKTHDRLKKLQRLKHFFHV